MGKQASAKPGPSAGAPKASAKSAAAKAASAKSAKDGSLGSRTASTQSEKVAAVGQKAEKRNKREEREAAEACRRAQRDAMMPPSGSESGEFSDDDNQEDPAEADRARAIAERERVKAEEETRKLRAAELDEGTGKGSVGRGRGVVNQGSGRTLGKTSIGNDDGDDEDEENDAPVGSARAAKAVAAEAKMLEKVEKGGKLSNKERRLYEKYLRKKEDAEHEEKKQLALTEEPPEIQRWMQELEAFSLNLPSAPDAAAGGDSVSVNEFSLAVPGNELLCDASLTLAKGHRYGLLGPNGMGKTTLLKFLATRQFPIPTGWTVALVAQEASATEKNVVDEVLCADLERLRLTKEEAELLAQIEAHGDGGGDADELAKLCDRLVQVGADLEVSGADSAEARVRQILIGLQFTDAQMEGKVSSLSGGWRMRVSLAKALFLAPDLLLLDEPTNHLDLDAVLWLDEFLSNEFKKTLLVVSHDADFLDSVCTDIIHLEGQLLWKYRGGYTLFKKQHAQRSQEREREYKKLVDQRNKATGSKARQIDKEQIEKARPLKQYTVKFNFLPLVTDKNEAGISVHDINFSYTDKKPWLIGPQLNFRISASDRIAVVGKNGAGKSTLLNLLTKMAWPSEGNVCHSKGLSIGRYSQHFEELGKRDTLTPVELLTDPEIRRFGAGIEKKEQAHKSLGQFGLPTHAHTRPIKELSGGQKARVQFALLTCRRPEILILDEPTNHLDIESVEEIISALQRYEGGFVLVSHDARLITSTQARLWEVDGSGKYKERGEGQSGFEQYRRAVLAEIQRRREKEAERARVQAEARMKRRAQAILRRASAKK